MRVIGGHADRLSLPGPLLRSPAPSTRLGTMTRVLLVEQAGDAAACLARTTGQLHGLGTRECMREGIDVVHMGTAEQPVRQRLAQLRCELDRAGTDGVAVALVSASVVVSDATMLRLLDDPAPAVAVLVSQQQADHPVAISGGVVLAASTAIHPVRGANAGWDGVLRLRADVVPAVAIAVRDSLADAPASWDGLDLLDLVLSVLVRCTELPISAVPIEPLPGARVGTDAQAEHLSRQLAGLNDERLTQRGAARAGDGFYSTFVLRRVSSLLTPQAIRWRLRPNTITSVSAAVGLVAAAAFALGSYPALIGGAVLLQISIVLDCVDGEVARASRRGSPFGAWLDGATDRLKEYAALAGLAIGAPNSPELVWLLAAAGMLAQTTRHMQDFAFDKEALRQWRESFRDARPLSDTGAWQRPRAAVAGTAGPESAGAWLRRIAHMPIGERWLVLSVAALAGSALAGLTAYLVLVGLALCWSVLGAIRRTVKAAGHITDTLRVQLADYRDDGLLRLLIGPRSPAAMAAWTLPVAVTALEGAVAIAATAVCAQNWLPAAFGWLAVVAWHRYDIVYRRGGRIPAVPVWVSLAGGGWALRTIVLVAAALAGVLPVVLVVGICWLFVVYVPESMYAGARTRVVQV